MTEFCQNLPKSIILGFQASVRPYTEELSSQGLAPQERPQFSFLINVSAKRVGTLIKIG
jgi:hypothetical protein